MHGNKYLII